MVPTGIDAEKAYAQLNRLEESLKQIQQLLPTKRTKTCRSALERLVQIAVEEALNMGNHIISGKGLPRPDSYREIFKVLEDQKIISKKLSQELQQFAVFRNRLVHLYWKIAEEEFELQLKKLGALALFAGAIAKYIKNEQ